METATETVTAAPAQDENQALQALLTRLNDPLTPTIPLARAVKAHLQTYHRTPKELAPMIKRSESWIKQLVGFLELREEVLTEAETKKLGFKELQALKSANRSATSAKNEPIAATSPLPQDPGAKLAANSKLTTLIPANSANKQTNKEFGQSPAVPSRETSRNPFRHGPRTEGGGGSEDKTVGELIVSVGVGLAFVPAYLFCWLVHQRAYDDLSELEVRAHRRALANGPWNTIRWALIALISLFILILCLPRIRQGIRWLRHPQTTPPASQTTGAPQPTLAVIPESPPPLRGRSEVGGPMKANTTPHPAPSPARGEGISAGNISPSARTPLVSAEDATQVMQAVVPQTPGITQRLGNALASIAGKTVTSGASAASPASSATTPHPPFPGPANLQWARIPGSRAITLTWQSQGSGALYNLYASYAKDTPSFDQDGYLLRQTSVVWTPPKKGVPVFLIYVTVVNPQGQESAPSPRLLVDLR